MDFNRAKQHILDRLEKDLPDNLYYHGLHHTLDVSQAIEEYARYEKVEGEDLLLLKTAGYYHDCGFTRQYRHHEEVGCSIAREALPHFGFTDEQIMRVCNMIMATRLPQQPRNLLEEIICDADLDYLGRDDFHQIAESLFKEFIAYGIVHNEQEWNRLQVKFFESHHYFTRPARMMRQAGKEAHLRAIKQIVAGYEEHAV